MDQVKFARGISAGAFLAVALGLATPANAQSSSTASSNLSVTATVTANCTITTSAVAFGSVNTLSATNVDASGGITVTCTNGTGWVASANAGGGTGASLLTRRMSAGSNTLSYSLYTNSSRTTVWGDGTGSTGTIVNSGTGSAQAIPIYGRIPSGQGTVPAGSYSDTVAVTVTY
jgi:spore coat protein U-like protein